MKLLRPIINLAAAAMLSIPAMQAASDEPTFNVGSYNIRLLTPVDDARNEGWSQRREALTSLVRFHEFDIFGTQEGFRSQLDEMRELLPGYEYIGVGRDDGKEAGEHSAIFYRTDLFDLLDHGDFWLSETPEKPGLGWDAACVRVCTWGKFRHKPSGREFLFFNLHMDHIGTTARVESAKLIKRKIDEFGSDLPTFLTGDFNVDQHSPSYATITEGDKLADTHEMASSVYEPNGTFNNFRTNGFTTNRIDHVFATPTVKVGRWGVLTDTYRTALVDRQPEDGNAEAAPLQYLPDQLPEGVKPSGYRPHNPSDHFPVLVTVTLP